MTSLIGVPVGSVIPVGDEVGVGVGVIVRFMDIDSDGLAEGVPCVLSL